MNRWAWGAAGLALVLVVANPDAAQAQGDCFVPIGVGGGQADPVVSLTDDVRVSSACRYALHPEGPWVPLTAGTRPFVALHAEVAAATAGGDATRPRYLYARSQGRQRASAVVEEPERLTLRLCSHYLLDVASAFALDAGETLTVSRVPGASTVGCTGEGLELRAFDLSGGAAAPPIRDGSGQRTLRVADGTLALPHGRWAFYAAPPDGTWALRVGLVDSTAPTTPLRSYVSEAGSPDTDAAAAAVPPIAAARWDGEGGALVFRPANATGSRSVLWAELRTSIAAGVAWLGEQSSTGVARVDGGLRFVPGGAGFQLSDALVDGFMAKRYGPAGRSLAPSLADWKGLVEGLAVCTATSYRDALAPNGDGSARWSVRDAPPGGWRCAKLAVLVDLEAAAKAQVAAAAAGDGAPAAGAPAPSAQVCLERGAVRVRAEGPVRESTGGGAPVCVPVDGGTPERVPIAVVGDRLTATGLGDRRLCLSVDGEPLEVPAADGALVLDRSGLVEVRLGAGGPDGCRSRQGLSLARVGVIDPDREWHPVGLYTGGKRRDGSMWRTLDHDEEGVFGYRPSRQTLDTRLSSSALVAAAVDAVPGRREQLPQSVPILGGVAGTFEGTTTATVQAYVSRDATCPTAPAGELADDVPLDPSRLLPDDTFHVFLVEWTQPEAPLHCLAHAAFRVRPARALVTAAPSEFLRLELGLLGDPRAVVFLTDPQAAGVYLPLVWFRIGFLPWLGLQVDASGVLAGAFDTPALSRTGLGFSASVDFGIPEILPRFVNVGAMVHLDGDWHPTDNPVASVFVAVNLAPLVHLAGGL